MVGAKVVSIFLLRVAALFFFGADASEATHGHEARVRPQAHIITMTGMCAAAKQPFEARKTSPKCQSNSVLYL